MRRTADTVIVYVHWGTETQACPNPQQEPLAQQLVKAGADIVIGSDAHVLLGAGYLGGAYVDYGLGNFAFYDNTAPETDSGTLIITAQGRHITGAVWRPATILDGLPQPLTGTPATTAVQSWNAARSCTNLSARPDGQPRHHERRDHAVRGPAGTAGHDDDDDAGSTGGEHDDDHPTAPSADRRHDRRRRHRRRHHDHHDHRRRRRPTTTSPTDNAG